MKTNVYVLRCENGKRYVGKTEDIQSRIKQHQTCNGSAWTALHKPVAVEKVYSNVSSFDEDKITKELMSKHGIDNVRGGTYSSTTLTSTQKTLLEKEIRGATDCCFKCGSKTHFTTMCSSSTTKKNDTDDYDDKSYSETDSEEDEEEEGWDSEESDSEEDEEVEYDDGYCSE